jgi:TrmH family RNA methyltransferase
VVRRLKRVGRRLEPGFVLLEGPRVLDEARLAGIPLELVAVREGEPPPNGPGAVTLAGGVFNSVSQTRSPQGVLAIGRAGYVPVEVACATAREAGWPLVVLDGVQDPANVGAIARTAAAAGAAAMVLLPQTADAFAPKAVRASAGNLFRLAVARGTWSDLQGLDGLGAAAGAETSYLEAPLETAGMIVLGSEAHGLSSDRLRRVAVPMAPGVESLNVAAAAAVLLYEVRRRRT